MHLDLDALRALDALVRLRSVTAAGRELGITQSATSHALARLRDVFGDPLLVRTPGARAGGMTPTPLAESLAAPVHKILDDVARLAEAHVAFDPRSARRTFTLAMSDGGQLLVLPALLARLAREAPGVSVVVRLPSPEDPRHLASGDVDLVLGRLGGDASALYKQVLIEDELVWVVRRGTHRRVTLAAYARRGRVQIEGRGGDPERLSRALASEGLPPVSTVTVNGLLAALMLVIRTDRVLTTTAETARALASALPIAACAPPVPLGSVAIAQHWHARVHADPAHAWLRGQIKHLCDVRAWR
jgi:molybdate transport repressor ModE-like protein